MRRSAVVMPFAALGIVFGDIGTSPLYAVKEVMYNSGADVSAGSEIGAISAIIWLLTLVICVKYISVVLRADDDKQGGVFALLALLGRHKAKGVVGISALLVFAAGMLFGDGIITPAISVLSAVEGLSVASDQFKDFTVPITLGILLVLFSMQSQGTHRVGKLFGPIMLTWFFFLGITGIHGITKDPLILTALNPVHAVTFLTSLDMQHLTLTLGSVILVVTGGEALFADLGHIGKRPIRQSWFGVVYPALILNYLGQGAYVLSGAPVVNHNIFFSMIPEWALYPSVALATVATVVASQALITGVFSLVAQGIALKYLPTLRVVHTHDAHLGQIYVPTANWLLFTGSAFLVVTFHSSGSLAAAYGLAVAADMCITTIAVAAVAKLHWKWPTWAVSAVFIPFAVIDGSLLLGNIWKIPHGGYVPLIIGAVMILIMTTWRWGREQVRLAFAEHSTHRTQDILNAKLDPNLPVFPRPMVMLTAALPRAPGDPSPPLLDLFYRRYGALPKQLILLQIHQVRAPYVDPAERYKVWEFQSEPDASMISVSASFGFREQPDVEDVIASLMRARGLSDTELTTWMIHAAKERIVGASGSGTWHKFRHRLFKFLRRQAEPAYSYFGLDDDARLTLELVPVVI
jgi:KUP system potassium uptake protein